MKAVLFRDPTTYFSLSLICSLRVERRTSLHHAPLAGMQVSSGQDGIQRLLAAEAEAQAVVAQARKGK